MPWNAVASGDQLCVQRCHTSSCLAVRSPAVRSALLAQYFNITCTAVMLGALFDAYLLIIGGSNEFVGDIESVRGIAALIFALPIGWAGDHWSKSRVLLVNLLCGCIAVALLSLGVPTELLPFIITGTVIFSVHNQCLYALLPTVMAELTKEGEERTQAIVNLQTMQSLGNASGPAVQIVMMLLLGRVEENSNGGKESFTWSKGELHVALLLGLGCFCLYMPIMLKVIRLVSRSGIHEDSGHVETARPTSDALNSQPRTADVSSNDLESCRMENGMMWLLATLCEVYAVVTAVGSGMTFKYWPLFFKVDFGFSPVGVCAMQLSIWIAIAGTAQLAPVLAKFVGRLPTANVLHISGTCLLFVISIQSLGVLVEVPLVLVRNALMNSGGPLVQALILDLVPKKHRGKWSSIASLRRVTWSGSAFVGGLLSDRHDYRYAFRITAYVHSVSGAVLLLMNILCMSCQKCIGARAAVIVNAT